MSTGADVVSEGVARQRKTVVTITQSGYYRIGKDVKTITCTEAKFSILNASGICGLFPGSVFAPPSDSRRDPQRYWIFVDEQALKAGPLQFEISYDGDVDLSQLLSRDEEREAEVVATLTGHRDDTARATSLAVDTGGAAESNRRPSIGCS